MEEDKEQKECPLCEVSEETLQRLKDNENKITKKEKYFLKKERKEKEHFNKIHRKKIKKIIGISFLALIAGFIIFSLANYIFKEKQDSNQGISRIEIISDEYDAGTVSMADGLVKHTYEIKNNGTGDLKIDKIWTSCMCTSAVLKVGDKTSPKFGMHNNPVLWSEKIAPGETGYLEVSFDPAFHGPEATGYINRTVYLSTNDSQNKKIEVKLIANVTP
ncbi:MAG TPA: DUF1573 domain-containing protein [bacterium]|nr:DUF1573 domain-containing protein [bacterium]